MGGAYVNEATPIIIKTEIFFNIYLSRNYLEGTYSKKFTLFNTFLSSFKPRIGSLHGGGIYAASGVLLMDVTNPKIGATQYSIFQKQ